MTPLASASPRRQLSMASAPSSPTQEGTTSYSSLLGYIFMFQKSQLATSYQRYPQLNLISAISKIGGLFAAAKFLSLFLSFWHEARYDNELKELTTTTATQEGGGEGAIEKSAKVI
jgi:hypothetical protein